MHTSYHWSPIHQPEWLERIDLVIGLSTTDAGDGIYGYELYRLDHILSTKGSMYLFLSLCISRN